MNIPLTPIQTKILGFIEDELDAGNGAPTCREICDQFDFKSPKAATDHLGALEKKGCIIRDPKVARGIRLVHSLRGIPILGEIPAGWPIDVVPESGERLDFDVESFGIRDRKQAFALIVKGDSMEGRHIFDGDVALIERGVTPEHGCVVAALIDNGTTLKTFLQREGKAWLQAENENTQYPNLIPAWDLQIQGVARAVFRKLRK